MSRPKKDKLFDLFKSGFKINLFYKPTMKDGDDFYYIILDDTLRLKVKKIDNVYVIDDITSLTAVYIKPIYEQLIRYIMAQSDLTVLVSMTGDSVPIQQACVACNAPLKSDDRYITVPLGYYNRLKSFYGDDITKYGFYILSVSDNEDEPEEDMIEMDEVPQKPQKSVNQTPIGVEPPISKAGKILASELKRDFPKVRIEQITKDSIECHLLKDENFLVEIIDDSIYIKELLMSPDTQINLVLTMTIVTAIEKLKSLGFSIFILNVQNRDLFAICNGKKFNHIQEEQRLPINKLFKQAFHGYGTYQVV